MFECAVMGPTLDGPPPGVPHYVDMPASFAFLGRHEIDRKQLAETLVFYDQVHLIGDPTHFANLISNIGFSQFLRLLESKRIKLTLTQSRDVRYHGNPRGYVFLIDTNLPDAPADNLKHLASLLRDASKSKERKEARQLIEYMGSNLTDLLAKETAKKAGERYSSLIDLAKTKPSVISDLMKAYYRLSTRTTILAASVWYMKVIYWKSP